MPVAPNKRDVQTFLSDMQQAIANSIIKEEKHIETRVAVITEKDRDDWAGDGSDRNANPARLLTLLGYDEDDMKRQPNIPIGSGGRTIRPDFIISYGGKEVFVLDVKAPGVNLDDPPLVVQVSTYLIHTNVALGILFNGNEMDVFVHPRLIKRPTDANNGPPKPLRVVSASGIEQLAETWCRFIKPTNDESKPRSTDWSITFARTLISQHKKEETGRERKRAIGQWLTDLLTNPDDLLFQAIEEAKLTPDGHDVTAKQMHEAWQLHNKVNSAPQIPKAKKRENINPKMSQLVAEVCRVRGRDFLLNQKIVGLRFSYEDDKRVQPVPNENGLFVAYVSGDVARKVIAQLEKLLPLSSP